MGLGMSKSWQPLTAETIAALPAQMGVYQIADASGAVSKIGYAGGKESFGMRSALTTELEAGGATFRHEFTHGYMTRWQELLMIHAAEFGAVPPANTADAYRIGSLSPSTMGGTA